jgi:hypothetical protein
MVMHFDQSWRVVASPLLQETNCYENNRSRWISFNSSGISGESLRICTVHIGDHTNIMLHQSKVTRNTHWLHQCWLFLWHDGLSVHWSLGRLLECFIGIRFMQLNSRCQRPDLDHQAEKCKWHSLTLLMIFVYQGTNMCDCCGHSEWTRDPDSERQSESEQDYLSRSVE